MSFERLASASERYYTGKFAEHGATARGVDWNSEDSQRLRFHELMRVVNDPTAPFSILDYGCGYGALADYLRSEGFAARYVGYDLSEPMVRHAGSTHLADDVFVFEETALPACDYAVASGLMNVKQAAPDADWERYCRDLIGRLAALSKIAFAFNMLTSYSDADRMRADLYYADPRTYFDLCKREHSRHVALLHDYGLYEFTLIVRKELR